MERKRYIKFVSVRPIARTFVFILVSMVLGLGLSAAAGDFPENLAGLKLLDHLEGAEARKMVYNLHGKDLRLDQAFILHYGSPAATSQTATIWVSRSKKEDQARSLMERMTGMIKGGSGPYGHIKEVTVKDTRVVTMFGKKRRHYIYRRGKDVVWIEVDYTAAEEFLEQALEKLR